MERWTRHSPQTSRTGAQALTAIGYRRAQTEAELEYLTAWPLRGRVTGTDAVVGVGVPEVMLFEQRPGVSPAHFLAERLRTTLLYDEKPPDRQAGGGHGIG